MTSLIARNPFGTMDVPEPFDADVAAFAAAATLDGSDRDDNATAWAGERAEYPLEGHWQSRWRGAADPTIAGDTPETWKQGAGELKLANDRLYLRFEWNGGVRKGLIEARRENGNRLVGKYINLSNPEITRPWIGLIIGNTRIDGRFPEGRLDFRR